MSDSKEGPQPKQLAAPAICMLFVDRYDESVKNITKLHRETTQIRLSFGGHKFEFNIRTQTRLILANHMVKDQVSWH